MRKNLICLLLTVYCLLFTVRPVSAGYVLPYPSYMPGNKMYRVSRIIDQAKKFWYWGSIASVKYQLGLADKYLVEAKTLFEYKQYLLAADALIRSDTAFSKIPRFIAKAKEEGKDVSLLEKTVHEAAQTHIQTLDGLKQIVPAEFTWTPEKSLPTRLLLKQLLLESINLRQQK